MPDSNQSSPDRPSKKASARVPWRKFYIRSGQAKWIVSAQDAETAALRFVQLALNDSVIPKPKPVNKKLELLDMPTLGRLIASLDEKILVSESGFTSCEAGIYATSFVIKRWRKRVAAVENLIRNFT